MANLKLILTGLFIVLLGSSTSANLTGSCYIAPDCTSHTAIFSVTSELGNSQGAVDPTHYPYKVCCPGTDLSAGDSCNGDDVVLRLSSTTNAHAEYGLLGNYPNKICLSSITDYVCSYSEGVDCDPAVNGYRIVRLSNVTNAHIDGSNLDYDNYICCRESSCDFTNVAISFPGQAAEGDSVTITLGYSSNCGSADTIQIDASSADGSCVVNVSGGNMVGMGGSFSIGNVVGTTTTSWIVPPIPAECEGKIVYGGSATIYDGGAILASLSSSGSVEFNSTGLAVSVCGDNNLDTPNDDGVNEECEFANPFIFDPLTDMYSCPFTVSGNDLIDCSYDLAGHEDCGECLYASPVVPPVGQFSYIEYGTCVDTPPEGDGFGEMNETIIVRWDNGTLISSTTSLIECQMLAEEVPFFDWINFMIVFLLISGYYFVGKRKLL